MDRPHSHHSFAARDSCAECRDEMAAAKMWRKPTREEIEQTVHDIALGAAWREAEATLPEGWRAWGLTALPDSVTAFIHGRDAYRSAEHPTPVAALRALAGRRSEPQLAPIDTTRTSKTSDR